jgi:predicted DNA repair protein MutK
MVAISSLMTLGVYGLVAGIVKLDDLGLHLAKEGGSRQRRALGAGILKTAPYLMKALSIGGTVAMFLVGGGIVIHGVPVLHHASDSVAGLGSGVAGLGGILSLVTSTLFTLVMGVLVGAVILGVVSAVKRVMRSKAPAAG